MNRLLERNLHQVILSNIQDIIWFGILDGTVEYVSPSVTALLGYAPQEMIGTAIGNFFHSDDLEHLTEGIAMVQDGKHVGLIHGRIRHKSGRYLWFENKFTAIHDQHGQFEFIVEIGRDITQRKRIEDRVARSERIAHVGSWERDVSNNTLYWSAEMYRIFGLEPVEAMPLDAWMSRVHPDDLHRVKVAVQNANCGHPYDIQYRIIRPSGEIRFVHALGDLVFENDVVTTVSGSLQDITESKQAKDELLKSKENLKLAQRIAHLGHWDWDITRNNLYWSDEAYRIFRMSPQDRSDFTVAGVYRFIYPDDREFVKQSILRALQGEPYDIEFRVILPDQSSRIVHCIGQTEFDDAGTPVQLFGTVQDITVQRQTEDFLRRSEKLAAAGQLAAGIAHEIRNPLTVLKGFIKLIQTSAVGYKEQYFDIIDSELNRIESIVSELLIFSKPQGVVFQQHRIGIILQEVITFLSTEAIMKNVLIESEYQQEFLMSTCEPNQLKQVFINVAKNAIEAMPNGGKLTVKLTSNNHSLFVQFIDQGLGIPADKIPRLGEPFYTTKEGGTGLGLMVSQKIILDHHGTLEISSEVGKGTRVTISLPLTPVGGRHKTK